MLNLFKGGKVKEQDHILFSFMTEKELGHGEDAPPLLIVKGNSCAVGVFDGMGGAGATVCNSSFGEGYTQAYVSSRVVCASMDTSLHNHLPTNDVDKEEMKTVIRQKLREEKEKFPPESTSALRSKLVREYPTTLAIVTLQELDKTYQVDSYWAGDSHCYMWTKDGFFQISKDDLEEDNDPMENLHNDSPISNCVCADRDFYIHHQHIVLQKEPVIILCASDGCFGYYQTPMHFENILKSCLQKAKNEKEWGQMLNEEISKVTGDDCSLSLIAKGFSSFEKLKQSMCSSIVGFSQLQKSEETIAWAEKELAEQKKLYEQNISAGWNEYKQNYMKYIKN